VALLCECGPLRGCEPRSTNLSRRGESGSPSGRAPARCFAGARIVMARVACQIGRGYELVTGEGLSLLGQRRPWSAAPELQATCVCWPPPARGAVVPMPLRRPEPLATLIAGPSPVRGADS